MMTSDREEAMLGHAKGPKTSPEGTRRVLNLYLYLSSSTIQTCNQTILISNLYMHTIIPQPFAFTVPIISLC